MALIAAERRITLDDLRRPLDRDFPAPFEISKRGGVRYIRSLPGWDKHGPGFLRLGDVLLDKYYDGLLEVGQLDEPAARELVLQMKLGVRLLRRADKKQTGRVKELDAKARPSLWAVTRAAVVLLWVYCLADLYFAEASEQTMFGYGAFGETKKRTLESGDIAGITFLYG